MLMKTMAKQIGAIVINIGSDKIGTTPLASFSQLF